MEQETKQRIKTSMSFLTFLVLYTNSSKLKIRETLSKRFGKYSHIFGDIARTLPVWPVLLLV